MAYPNEVWREWTAYSNAQSAEAKASIEYESIYKTINNVQQQPGKDIRGLACLMQIQCDQCGWEEAEKKNRHRVTLHALEYYEDLVSGNASQRLEMG